MRASRGRTRIRARRQSMRIRSLLQLLLPVAIAFLTACPPPLALNIYNNTGIDLVVLLEGKRVVWQKGKTLRVADRGDATWEDLQWEHDAQRQVTVPVLRVELNGQVLRYGLGMPGLPGEYTDRRTGIWERYLQIQPDRKLHVVKPGSRFPAAILPQPPGFPIAPIP